MSIATLRRWFGPVDADAYRDELGLVAPIPAHHGQRRMPEAGFATGPEVGERLPEFTLWSATGEAVDFHVHRQGAQAAVVFLRSAVW